MAEKKEEEKEDKEAKKLKGILAKERAKNRAYKAALEEIAAKLAVPGPGAAVDSFNIANKALKE